MLVTMDPPFPVRPPSQPWHHHHELSEPLSFHGQPVLSLTSPPATPMTPITPHPPPVYPMSAQFNPTTTAQLPQSTLPVDNSVPTLSHPFPPPEYRLYELCDQLQRYSQMNKSESKIWWEQFGAEFFHDAATLVVEVDFGDGMRKYSLQRHLLPWYYSSLFDNSGVVHVCLHFRHISHHYVQNLQRFEIRDAVQELEVAIPHEAKVCSKGRLVLDFTIEEKPRIFLWHFTIQGHQELIPRAFLASHDVSISNNLMCSGLPASTQSLLLQQGHVSISKGALLDHTTIGNNSTVESQQSEVISHNAQWMQHQQQQQLLQDHRLMMQVSPSVDGSVLPPPLPLPIPTHLPITLPPLNNGPSSTPSTPSLAPSPSFPRPGSIPPPLPTSSNTAATISTTSLSSTCNHGDSCECTQSSSCRKLKISTATPITVMSSSSSSSSSSPPVVVLKPAKSVTIKSQVVMVADEPTPFTEDMVHGEDERCITRIDNQTSSSPTPASSLPSTPPSLCHTASSSGQNTNPPVLWMKLMGRNYNCNVEMSQV